MLLLLKRNPPSEQNDSVARDCDIRKNTPDLKCAGIHKLSNEVEFKV